MKYYFSPFFILFSIFSYGQQTSKSLGETSLKPKKIALVIGNNNYPYLSSLQNSINDAVDMKIAFEKLSYSVIFLNDASIYQTKQALSNFRNSINKNDIVAFYYSGHGFGYNGKNYILPVDTQIRCLEDVEQQGLPIDGIIESLSTASMRTIIIDACRNNRNIKFCADNSSKSSVGFFRPNNMPLSTFISFATQEGMEANEDPKVSRNSVFTTELLKFISKPNLTIRTILDSTTNKVKAKSDYKQIPSRYDELNGDFYLSGLKSTNLYISEIYTTPCQNDPNKKCESTKDFIMSSQIGYGETESAAIRNAEVKVQSNLARIFGSEVKSLVVNQQLNDLNGYNSNVTELNSNIDSISTNFKIYKFEKYCENITSVINETGKKIYKCYYCGQIPVKLNVEMYEEYLRYKTNLSKKEVQLIMEKLRAGFDLPSANNVGALVFLPSAAQFKRNENTKAILLGIGVATVFGGPIFNNLANSYKLKLRLYSNPLITTDFINREKNARTASNISYIVGFASYLLNLIDGFSQYKSKSIKKMALIDKLEIIPYSDNFSSGINLSYSFK